MENRSCKNCPSYMTSADSSQYYRKSVGVPICLRYNKVIGRQGWTREEFKAAEEHFASKCPSYGAPTPQKVDWAVDIDVALPLITSHSAQSNPELVSSCATCTYFIPEHDVIEKWGWTAAMCALKGKLLLGNRLVLEARNCEERSLNDQSQNFLEHVHILPEYTDGFFLPDSPAKLVELVKANQQNFVDPSEYETDRPVSKEDAERGIRAWREIKDYRTNNTVILPIYRRDFFTADQQAKIPQTGDDEHPEDYVDFAGNTYTVSVLWTELDETPAFWGRAGTGKTEFGRYMAWLMQLPFERFSITHSTELDDLAGKMLYTEGVGTHFQKGRLVKAWESPCVMVIDEPNAGPRDVWEFLRPMTDNSKQLVLDQSNGEVATRNLDCYLFLAMNPAWDHLNIGTLPIADADANRLEHIELDLPPEELEREIIITRCKRDGWDIPIESLDLVMKIANDLRKLSESQTLGVSWAIRPQLKVARNLRWFEPIKAYRLAVADFLEPAQRELVIETVIAHTD